MNQQFAFLFNLIFTTIILNQVTFVYNFLEEHNPRITYLEGRIGGYVVFNCHIEFPFEVPIPYVLNWLKDVKK